MTLNQFTNIKNGFIKLTHGMKNVKISMIPEQHEQNFDVYSIELNHF